MHVEDATTKMVAAARYVRFCRPVISEKTNAPHKAPMSPGPAAMSGNAIESESLELATNQLTCAMDQMEPAGAQGAVGRGGGRGGVRGGAGAGARRH